MVSNKAFGEDKYVCFVSFLDSILLSESKRGSLAGGVRENSWQVPITAFQRLSTAFHAPWHTTWPWAQPPYYIGCLGPTNCLLCTCKYHLLTLVYVAYERVLMMNYEQCKPRPRQDILLSCHSPFGST